MQEGFKIEYWDLSKIFNRQTNINEEIPGVVQIKIETYKQLEKKIVQYVQFSLFIFNITYYGSVYKLFSVFSKHKCLTSIFARGTLPYPSSNYSLVKKFFFRFKALKSPQYIRETLLNQIAIGARRFKLVKPYNFIFYAGADGVSNVGCGYKFGIARSKLIPINSFDYDAYLMLKQTHCRHVKQRYCVFLDNYLPYHPDLQLLDLPQLNAEKYYTSLNNFFHLIEQTFNIEVIIAAHPKSTYEGKTSYGKRIVIKNKTAELVKYADFVVSHVSTSVSFAVLFKKPLVFVYTNEIKKLYPLTHYQLVIYFAGLLNTSCINTDEAFEKIVIKPLDDNAYNKYKYSYLTSPQSEQKFSEDIFINTLKPLKTSAD